MKKVYLLALVALFTISCSQHKTTTDLNRMNIKGNVSFVTDTIWNTEELFGEVVKTGVKNLIKYEINDQGNITNKVEYGSDGKLTEKTIYAYNEEDLILSEKCYKDDGSLYYSYTYTYIDDNKYKINTVWDGYLKYTEEDVYYKTNNLIDSICTVKIEDGEEFKTKQVFEQIDELSCKSTMYNADGSKSEEIQYMDENLRLIKVEGINQNLKVEWAYKDDLLSYYSYQSEDWSSKAEYKYKFDNKGNWIEKIEYKTNKNGITRIEEMTTRNIQYK